MSLTLITPTNKTPTEVRHYATGRRKEASARVWISKGTGKISINGQTTSEYFKLPMLVGFVQQAFEVTGRTDQYNVLATVKGGGLSGQAQAIRHGISRALDEAERDDLHTILRQNGFLTRDSRTVERKKYGRKKARKRFQFSKR